MHSSIRSGWGDICGLSPSDLPDDLLRKINFEKLLECLEIDERVSHLVAAKMLEVNISSIQYIKNIPEATIFKFPNIISMYNRYIEKNSDTINTKNRYERARIVFWNLLDERNKEKEVLRWIGKLSSVVNANSVDYKWLFEKHPDTADQLVKKVWEQKGSYHYGRWGQDELKHMIKNIPESKLEEVMSEVFKGSKHLQLEALGNPNLKEEHIVKALKIFAKKSYVPNVRAKVSKSILEKLPTITRLEVIEKLVSQRATIYDIKSEDDFKSLLFGSIIRYPGRVERAVEKFRYNTRSDKQ